jgi:hypothetical protein
VNNALTSVASRLLVPPKRQRPFGTKIGTGVIASPTIRPAVTRTLTASPVKGLVLSTTERVLVVASFHVSVPVPLMLKTGKHPLADSAGAVIVADVSDGWLPLGDEQPDSCPLLTDALVAPPLSGGEKLILAEPAQLRSTVSALAVALVVTSPATQQAPSTAKTRRPRRLQRPVPV